MKKHTIIFIVALILFGIVLFSICPWVEPMTAKYHNTIFAEKSQTEMRALLKTDIWNLYMVKGLIKGGFWSDVPKYLGRLAGSTTGIIILISIVYLFTWILWIYLCWIVGKSKNRIGLSIVVGLFLGIIGLLIIALLPKRE